MQQIVGRYNETDQNFPDKGSGELQIDDHGNLKVLIVGSAPSAGSATADNQTTQIDLATTANDDLAYIAGDLDDIDTSTATTATNTGTIATNTATTATNTATITTTLTGGTAQAIIKGGAKGVTSAAIVTSSANGADRQGIDTVSQFMSAAEDNVAARFLVEQRNSYLNITTATTTTVKSAAGFLHLIQINKAVATGTIAIFDNTAGSGTLLGTVTMPAALLASQITLRYDVSFATGLTIVTTQAQDISVSYR